MVPSGGRRKGGPRRLEEAFTGLLQRALPDDEEVRLIFIRELWERMVGSEVSRHTDPVGLSEKQLRIAVREEIWLNQLRPMLPLLAGKINGYWGETLVERISLEIHR